MWPLLVLLGIGAGAAGAYALMRKEDAPSTGEIYGIGLDYTPPGVNTESVGQPLAHAMGWDFSAIEDGNINRYPDGKTMLTIGFKANARTPMLPPVGFTFQVGGVNVTVTSVTKAPARVGMSSPYFP